MGMELDVSGASTRRISNGAGVWPTGSFVIQTIVIRMAVPETRSAIESLAEMNLGVSVRWQ
jgi:hypothetical protein